MRNLGLILGLVACGGSATDSGEPTACDETTGEIWGEIIDYEGGPHGGNTVVYITPDGGDVFSLPATSEGRYEVSVSPGRYQISAESDWGCLSDPNPEVEVQACEEVQADLLMYACFGR